MGSSLSEGGQQHSAGEWQTLLFYRPSLLSHIDGGRERAFEVGPASHQDEEIGHCCAFCTAEQGAQHGNAQCVSAAVRSEQTDCWQPTYSKKALQMYYPPPSPLHILNGVNMHVGTHFDDASF